MFKKLQKTFVTLLVLLVSGMIPTLSAIAAELEAVPEFKGESGGVIEVVQGSSVNYDLKLSYTGGNKNNTSGAITVYTNYQISGSTPDKSGSATIVPFSGETFSNTLNGKINAKNAVPGTYTVPVNVTIKNNENGKGNEVVNATSDNLIVKVLPNDTTPPIVTITNPVNGGFYQSGQLPDEPQFTVNEDYQVPATFTGWSKAEETHKLTVSVKDLAGNVGTSSEITYTVDDTPPVITADIVNGGVYNADKLKDKTKNYYSVNEPTITLTADELDLTVGQHTVHITAIDRAGNKTERNFTYIIDNDAPSISFKFEDSGYYKSSVFSAFNPYYKVEDDNLDEGSIKASTLDLSEGTHSVTVSAFDFAKNYNSATATYTIDDTEPTVTIHLENGKYYNTSSLNGIEDFFSIFDKNPVTTKADGFGTTDGHYQASVNATDAAGNSTTKNVEYYVDTKDPVITIDSQKIASGGFYKSSYLENLSGFYSVEDANIDNVEVSPFVLTEGQHTLIITATDKAGNSTTERVNYTVDNSAPTISFNLKANGYYQSANLLNEYFTASDNNGVISVVADALKVTEGTHTLKVTARDAAGNSTTESITYTVDDKNPVVSISLPKDGGYYQSSALPDEPEYKVDDSSPVPTTNIVGYNKEAETTHTVTVTATDAAGNTGSASATYTVDNTRPEITSKLVNGGYYNKETLENIGDYYEVHDANLDPETGITASNLVFTEGEHKAVITAVDKAGNKNEYTIHYTVDNTKPTITFNFNDGGYY
ncbi:Ig-like domain-containing protein, partial [Neobacillus citreus]